MKKYLQAAGIWCLIVPLAILNGGLRENILVQLGGAALPLSGIILSACIFAVAYLLVPRIKGCTTTDYIAFGIMWLLLTNLFDLGMILADSGDVLELARAYDFTTGNLWILVVATTAVSPYLVSRLKGKRSV